MAVRAFNGSTDLINCAVGALGSSTFGTYAALVKRGGTGNWHTFMALHSSGGSALNQFAYDNSNNTAWWIDGITITGPAAIGTSAWGLVIVRKATGTATPRFSLYNFTTDTWTHANGSGTRPNWSAPTGGTVRMEWEGFDRFNGRMAVRAAWNSLPWAANTTGDAAIEAAGLETSLQNWLDASPDALWAFNQAAVTETVDDLTGGGADQTARTGTTVVTGDDPPGFSFTLGGITRDIDDTLGLTDAIDVDFAGAVSRTVNDTLGLTDAVTIEFTVVINDTLGLTDSGQTVDASEGITDTLGLTDTVDVDFTGTTGRTINDVLGLTDAVTVEGIFARNITDDLGITDTAAVDRALGLTDDLGLSDTVDVEAAGATSRTISDNLGLTDAIVRESIYARDASDTLGLSDIVNIEATYVRNVDDMLSLSDVATPQVFTEIDRAIGDTLGLSDDVIVVLNPATPPEGPRTLVAVESGHTLVAIEPGRTLNAVESGHTLVAVE